MISNNFWKRVGLCVGLTGWLVAGNLPAAFAQSDPAGFDTVINSPPSTIGNDFLIGSNTQLNVTDGGAVGFRGEAGSYNNNNTNIEENVSGGSIGNFFEANNGSTVNISGGVIGTGFEAMPGSTVNISGGSIAERFIATAGSSVTLVGAEFLLNGVAPANPSEVTLTGTDILTGTFQDGNAFVFTPQGRSIEADSINGVALQTVPLPPIDLTPITISGPEDVAPNGLRAGQTLTLEGTGDLPVFIANNATLDIAGGSTSLIYAIGTSVNITDGDVGRINAYTGSQINISGGEVASRSDAFDGSVVNISDGLVGNLFVADTGSTVNVSGGVIDGFFSAFDGSTINISGGEMGTGFRADSGSTVVVSGGKFGDLFRALSGSAATFVGGEFLLNGAVPPDLSSVTLSASDVLTGTLEDGSTFIFSPTDSDTVEGVTLSPAPLPAVDLNPIVITNQDDLVPNSLRAGQSLTFQSSSALPSNFAAIGSTLTFDTGNVAGSFEVADSIVNIINGDLQLATVFRSTVNIEGGSIDSLSAQAGTTVNQSAGGISFTSLGANSVFNLRGGTLGSGGGTFNPTQILASAGSTLNLFVSEASIDGVALDLVVGDMRVIEQRGFETMLSGVLTDGSEFSFLLQPLPFIPAIGGDAFAPGSTITVTLVPEIILGDVSRDGVVNFLDIGPFVEVLASGDFRAEADVNQDGEVNFLDIFPFIEILAGG